MFNFQNFGIYPFCQCQVFFLSILHSRLKMHDFWARSLSRASLRSAVLGGRIKAGLSQLVLAARFLFSTFIEMSRFLRARESFTAITFLQYTVSCAGTSGAIPRFVVVHAEFFVGDFSVFRLKRARAKLRKTVGCFRIQSGEV